MTDKQKGGTARRPIIISDPRPPRVGQFLMIASGSIPQDR